MKHNRIAIVLSPIFTSVVLISTYIPLNIYYNAQHKNLCGHGNPDCFLSLGAFINIHLLFVFIILPVTLIIGFLINKRISHRNIRVRSKQFLVYVAYNLLIFGLFVFFIQAYFDANPVQITRARRTLVSRILDGKVVMATKVDVRAIESDDVDVIRNPEYESVIGTNHVSLHLETKMLELWPDFYTKDPVSIKEDQCYVYEHEAVEKLLMHEPVLTDLNLKAAQCVWDGE